MDPVTGTLLATLGTSLLKDIFSPPAPAGPSQAQILAMLQQQQKEQQAQQRAWLIGGALVGVGILAFVLVARK